MLIVTHMGRESKDVWCFTVPWMLLLSGDYMNTRVMKDINRLHTQIHLCYFPASLFSGVTKRKLGGRRKKKEEEGRRSTMILRSSSLLTP